MTSLKEKLEIIKNLKSKASLAQCEFFDILPIEIVQGDVIHRTNPSSRQVCNSSSAWGATQDNHSAHKIRPGIELLNATPLMLEVIEELEFELAKLETELQRHAEDAAGEDL